VTGIIFEGEASAIVEEFTEYLQYIGLLRESDEKLTPEILAALNEYRLVNALPELDFCDPAVLRSLGISCSGDEILMLARYAEARATTEISMFDVCREAIEASRNAGLSIWEYTRDFSSGILTNSAVTAAILALLY